GDAGPGCDPATARGRRVGCGCGRACAYGWLTVGRGRARTNVNDTGTAPLPRASGAVRCAAWRASGGRRTTAKARAVRALGRSLGALPDPAGHPWPEHGSTAA